MVSSNSTTCSNSKRHSFPWISNNKGKAEKAYFCRLQSPFGRRRYLRRGSKTSKMLQAALNELDESVHTTCSTTPPSSAEFSLPSESLEFTLTSVAEEDAALPKHTSSVRNHQLSSMDRKRHSVSLLTSALAITTIADDSEQCW